ncbi:MAG TPA: hypothetical protein VIF15_13220 [Polyangiaceae bacterium]|jgi:hypothetical protein
MSSGRAVGFMAVTCVSGALWASGCATAGAGYDVGSSGGGGAGAPGGDAASPVDGATAGDGGGSTHDDGAGAEGGGGDDGGAGGAGSVLDAANDTSTGVTTDGSVLGQKTIFVSSVLYAGNLGGLGGADAKCQTLAAAASLSGIFAAWLSDGTGTAAARLTHSSGAYVLVDGTVVANDWTGLASGTLLHSIDRTEQNGAPSAGSASSQACFGLACAWTNTNADGTLAQPSYSCKNWSSASQLDNAVLGETTATTAYWSSFATSSGICDLTAPLYCVEQ